MADTQCAVKVKSAVSINIIGLSPRMFHAAWHFHYPKLPCRSPRRLKPATNVRAIEWRACTCLPGGL